MARISSGNGYISKPDTDRKLGISISHIHERNLSHSIRESFQLHGSGIIGVIVNTVARAMDIAGTLSSIFGEDVVTVAHSRFISVDRFIKDSEVLDLAGKNSNRKDFRIIVGTQVLEQSLDIDFDLLYSDIAPIDSLIQRMGRLHRHERDRSYDPEFVILQEEITDELTYKSARKIYGEWRVSVSEEYFTGKKSFSLPREIEEAVEWLPTDYLCNPSYKEFINNNLSIRKKSNDFAMAKATSKKNKSIHGCFNVSIPEDKSKLSYIEAQVRNIELLTVEVIALFEGENGGIYVPIYKDGKREKFFINTEGEMGWQEEKNILSSTIKLPSHLSTLRAIGQLESMMETEFSQVRNHWKNSKILSNELAIIFPSSKNLKLADSIIEYNPKIGLETANV